MFTSRRMAIFIALLSMFALVAVACGSDDPPSSSPQPTATPQQIDWIDSPYFFRRGNVFAIYIGNDAEVLEALSTATRSLLLQEKQG